MKDKVNAWLWQLGTALGLIEQPLKQPIPIRDQDRRQPARRRR